MVVFSYACSQSNFVIDEACGPSERAVRQLSGDSPESLVDVSDQSKSFSLSLYSPEEIAKKQRDGPAFPWLFGFLDSGILSQESELILSGPNKKCYSLEREQFRMDKEGAIWKVYFPDLDKLLVPSSLRTEVISTVHDIPSSGHQGIQHI